MNFGEFCIYLLTCDLEIGGVHIYLRKDCPELEGFCSLRLLYYLSFVMEIWQTSMLFLSLFTFIFIVLRTDRLFH